MQFGPGVPGEQLVGEITGATKPLVTTLEKAILSVLKPGQPFTAVEVIATLLPIVDPLRTVT